MGVRKVEQVSVQSRAEAKDRRARLEGREQMEQDMETLRGAFQKETTAEVQTEVIPNRFKDQRESFRGFNECVCLFFSVYVCQALIWVLGTQEQTKQNPARVESSLW